MKAKYHYIVLCAVVVSLLAVLSFLAFQENKVFLFLSEIFILLLIVYAFWVYNQIFKPIQLLQQGLDALADEDFNVKFAPTKSKDINKLVLVYNAMIDKLRNERVYQQEQHYFLNLLIDAMPVGIIILDFDQKISEFNPQAQQMFKLSNEDISLRLSDIKHQIGKQLNELEVGQSKIIRIESVNYYRCNANRFMYKGFPRTFVLVEELSNEILENEKQAYGKVIRMMAHEVNNSIGAINSILNSITSSVPIDEGEVKEYLPIIIDRNEGLTQFMKNFAKVIRLPNPVFEKMNINHLLQDVVQLMSLKSTEQQISISTNFQEPEFFLQADRGQLEQAFINIIKNSIEAINHNKGEIIISTNAKDRTIIIQDNGVGVSTKQQEKLFTPFYSTKTTGQGVGLTLVKEILYNHNYQFSLTTKNELTEFKVEV